MRLAIYAIGRLKSAPEQSVFENYWSRAAKSARGCGLSLADIREFSESRQPQAARRCREEFANLTGAVPGEAFSVALDQRGRQMTSRQFASLIAQQAGVARKEMAFLIGGPDGHDQANIGGCGMTLGFGRMTWPHRLTRIMLAEQIYRAITILSGHPYHRE